LIVWSSNFGIIFLTCIFTSLPNFILIGIDLVGFCLLGESFLAAENRLWRFGFELFWVAWVCFATRRLFLWVPNVRKNFSKSSNHQLDWVILVWALASFISRLRAPFLVLGMFRGCECFFCYGECSSVFVGHHREYSVTGWLEDTTPVSSRVLGFHLRQWPFRENFNWLPFTPTPSGRLFGPPVRNILLSFIAM
jgi:hypothetical protein